MVDRRPGWGGYFGIGAKRERDLSPEEQLYAQASAFYRAWHLAEGRTRDVIDFDLREQDPLTRQQRQMEEKVISGRPNLNTRNSIVTTLEALSERADSARPRSESGQHDLDFAKAQILASLWFAKKRRGDNLSPLEYIEHTSGLKPEMISEDALREQKRITLELLKDKELGIQEEPSERTMLGLRQDLQINPQSAQEDLKTYTDQAIGRIRAFLGRGFKSEYSIQPVNENAFYWVWADSNREGQGFLLRQNFGPRKIWTPGKAQELGWHEGGEHISRMANRLEQIREGKLNKFFEITTTHGPESLVEEGLAQTLVFFIPGAYDSLSPEGKFQVNATILRNMAYSNVHLMVNNPSGYDKDKVVRYLLGYVPWEQPEDIEQQIEWRKKDPLLQTYLWTYGMGASLHLDYAAALDDQGKRSYLTNLHRRPYTPSQEQALVRSLTQKPDRFMSDMGRDTPIDTSHFQSA